MVLHALVLLIIYMYSSKVLCFNRSNECFAVPTQHLFAADKIWKYLKFNQKLKKSDIIIGLGSHDKRVAIEAARLWLDGWASTLMFSGKSGNLTKDKWKKSEAEIFYDIAISMGVPSSSILLETESTNTGENFRLCYRRLKEIKKLPKRIIVVQKPHMGRRTYATFMKQWPSMENKPEFIVTSQNISLEHYPNDDVGDLRQVISVVIGYLQRMQVYSDLGYQIPMYIPDDVWKAYALLVNSGYYCSHLV